MNNMCYIVQYMKTFMYFQLFVFCSFLFSCTENNPSRSTYYSKCYFLGENSFTFEGETLDALSNEPIPFDSVIVRLDTRSFRDYESWEIHGTNISKNKFRIEIDITANGITIDKDTITDDFYKPYPYRFPDNFPAVELSFYLNDAYYSNPGPLLKELVYLSKTEYNYFYCHYLFVAEPIDLSGKDIREGNGMFGYFVDTYYYDLNFTKQGWYKIVGDYRSEFNNDPKYSSSKNNYFFE